MAIFSRERIRDFSNARANASPPPSAADLTYTFNRYNGFDNKLRSAGYTRVFYWEDGDCYETDIRDSDQGRVDASWVDAVDIFLDWHSRQP